MDGGHQTYRYLENLGNGLHLIILENGFVVPGENREAAFTNWVDTVLPESIKNAIQPVNVGAAFDTGSTFGADIGLTAGGWVVRDFADLDLPEVIADRTRVTPEPEGGVRRAFSLSLADVQHLSATGGIGFMNAGNRIGQGSLNSWWELRTPSTPANHWVINGSTGGLVENHTNMPQVLLRPAFIIRQ